MLVPALVSTFPVGGFLVLVGGENLLNPTDRDEGMQPPTRRLQYLHPRCYRLLHKQLSLLRNTRRLVQNAQYYGSRALNCKGSRLQAACYEFPCSLQGPVR